MPNRRIALIAEQQQGVVSTGQLHRCGLGDKAIARRVSGGWLHRVHRGVYAVGHSALSPRGHWFAAVLALGGGPHPGRSAVLEYWGAAVSHSSAAFLWELLPVRQGPCDVSVAGDGGRIRRAGVRTHRSTTLRSAHVTLRHGIPVTTPTRTISDLRRAVSGGVSDRELRKAIRQANVIGLSIDDDMADRTRGDLEGAFLEICGRHGLPRPEVNVRIGAFLIDFLWRGERLAVETDDYLHHRGRAAFQDDRARELELMRLGYDVLRLSEAQINGSPKKVAEVLRAELRRRHVVTSLLK